MGKKHEYVHMEDVGLFHSRASVQIYEYFLANERDGRVEPVDWTRLRDAMFGELSFMEHDEYVIFEIEVLNPSLEEIQERTGRTIEAVLEGETDDGEPMVAFVEKT